MEWVIMVVFVAGPFILKGLAILFVISVLASFFQPEQGAQVVYIDHACAHEDNDQDEWDEARRRADVEQAYRDGFQDGNRQDGVYR